MACVSRALAITPLGRLLSRPCTKLFRQFHEPSQLLGRTLCLMGTGTC